MDNNINNNVINPETNQANIQNDQSPTMPSMTTPPPIIPSAIAAPAGGHIAIIISIIINVLVITALSWMIYYFGIPTINDKLMIAETQRQEEVVASEKKAKDLMDKIIKMQKEQDEMSANLQNYNNNNSHNNPNDNSTTTSSGISGIPASTTVSINDNMTKNKKSTTTSWVKSK